MKLFNKKPVPASGGELEDVQIRPLALSGRGSNPPAKLKVDLAYHANGLLVVAGWSSSKLELGLQDSVGMLEHREVRIARPDVAANLGLATGDELGFVLLADYDQSGSIALSWQQPGGVPSAQPLRLEAEAGVRPGDFGPLGAAAGVLARLLPADSPQWHSLVAKLPAADGSCQSARAFLEAAAACGQTESAVVVGWVVHTPNARVWLEDDIGRVHSLEDAFRLFRQDVHDTVAAELGLPSHQAGFIARIQGVRAGETVRLKAATDDGVYVLATTALTSLPSDPVAASRWLFAVGTPLRDMHRRIPLIDAPTLDPLISRRQQSNAKLPVQEKQLGVAPASPKASVIVPLYGRFDFVEHQLLELAEDAWFARYAELIYVIDDPKLVEPFLAEAESLYRLYRVPFRWVWGNANRGFSGANNLGARHARGQHLIFLNSDAFPQQPGWLQALSAVLDAHPDVGAVGPRLVFADGSIQHAGMEFMRRDELGIWVNHHPYMGLDASLDPHKEITTVTAATGACLAVRRTDFERVGGWDSGYLIGDFEDSDLCLKLRAEGLRIAYLPEVQLTHLERQSFKLLGQDDFRMRVVIYNAVRHQQRWASLIESPQDLAAPKPIASAV